MRIPSRPTWAWQAFRRGTRRLAGRVRRAPRLAALRARWRRLTAERTLAPYLMLSILVLGILGLGLQDTRTRRALPAADRQPAADPALTGARRDEGVSVHVPRSDGGTPIFAARRPVGTPLFVLTPTPTFTPTPTWTFTPTFTPTYTPTPTHTPTPTPTPTYTPTPTPTYTPTPTSTPTPTPIVYPYVSHAWDAFAPSGQDHFWISHALLEGAEPFDYEAGFPYGNDLGGRYILHHGLDLRARQGMRVRAGVQGEVTFAGWDAHVPLGKWVNRPFYGYAVAIRLDRALPLPGRGDAAVYLLLGHLHEVWVEAGERVAPADFVGTAGQTGVAIGPHLHLEVRIGRNRYENTVNPLLWIAPLPGTGVVAVRVTSREGRIWEGASLQLLPHVAGRVRGSRNYKVERGIRGDPFWGETSAFGNVPAGTYTLRARLRDEILTTPVTVAAGRTTFVALASDP